MKAIVKFILYTSVWIIAPKVPAQEHMVSTSKVPRWISEKGFWQIESSIHSPQKSIVYFYNNENTLVYKEHVHGFIFDLNKKRVKMKLKKALDSALIAWNKNRILQSDQHLVRMLFIK